MSALEAEMAALLGAANSLGEESKKTAADAGKTRRKSKDLEDQMAALQDGADKWHSLGRKRRESRDYTDEELEAAFKEMDIDGSGFIEKDELRKAIEKVDPNCSDETAVEMIAYADADGDGRVDVGEFKKIMLYRHDEKKE